MEYTSSPKPQLSSRANAFSIAALMSSGKSSKDKETEESTIKPLGKNETAQEKSPHPIHRKKKTKQRENRDRKKHIYTFSIFYEDLIGDHINFRNISTPVGNCERKFFIFSLYLLVLLNFEIKKIHFFNNIISVY